jgi:hypothetical protein
MLRIPVLLSQILAVLALVVSSEETLKFCNICKQSKPLTEFYPNPTRKSGVQSNCKICHNKMARRWEKENPEARQASWKRYRDTHPDERREARNSWAHRNPDKVRMHRVKSKYNITREEYVAILESQQYECPICKQKLELDRNCHLDHNHQTGDLRLCLCGRCNVLIGFAHENPEVLENAAAYLCRFL